MAARKPDIQYIDRFYIYGSEARAPELKPVKKRKAQTTLPVRAPEKQEIRIDLLATCAIAVCLVMMVLMSVGFFQYRETVALNQAMENHVIELQNKNVELREEYLASFDEQDIRGKAEALGMIPARCAEKRSITLTVSELDSDPNLWEDICWFFSGLFA